MPAVFGSSSRAQAAVEVVHQLDYTLVPASHGLQLLFADVMTCSDRCIACASMICVTPHCSEDSTKS